MKIRPVGAELFQADRWTDGRTDMAKLIVAFRYFANALKMSLFSAKTKLLKAKLLYLTAYGDDDDDYGSAL
jgi:hypothetical protein